MGSVVVQWPLRISGRNMFTNFIFRSVAADSKTANSLLCDQIVPGEANHKSVGVLWERIK